MLSNGRLLYCKIIVHIASSLARYVLIDHHGSVLFVLIIVHIDAATPIPVFVIMRFLSI